MNLRMQGYAVHDAADGDSGMSMAFSCRPDLIILDIMMPVWSGLEILEALRERGETMPVLMLSALGATPDKVHGLDLGADDYLAKPFDLPELLARVAAMLRRSRKAAAESNSLTVGALTIDLDARSVDAAGRSIVLSAKEFDLLWLLADAPGRVFSRETILEKVWGWDYEGTARTVDNFIASLRRKLAPGKPKQYIKTVLGVGYQFQAQD